MNSIPVLGIPHYNRPDLLARCLESIDYPVDRLVIIQNGPEAMEIGQMGRIGRIFDVRPGCNMGVAASWNYIIKNFPAPWWMICNNDICFAPGDLERMAQAAGLAAHEPNPRADVAPASLLYGNHGASWFVITREGVRTVGLFDENFWPAYLEDCDWQYRSKLAGARVLNVEGLRAVHGDTEDPADQTQGSCTIHSDKRLAEANMRTHGRNFEYYRVKWGGINGQEVFEKPFNGRPGRRRPARDGWVEGLEGIFLPELREKQVQAWDK